MIITAHGGAMKTGRNTLRYLDAMTKYPIDAIEVDIRRMGKTLYLAHTPLDLLSPKKLTLSTAFEYVAEFGWKINCDVKQKGLVKPVLDLAKKMKVQDKVMFTGSVCRDDVADVDAGVVYLNASFFGLSMLTEKRVKEIKEIIDGLNNERVAGINLNYRIINEGFAKACKENSVDISAFTIDNAQSIAKISGYPSVCNITTNIPDVAIKVVKK